MTLLDYVRMTLLRAAVLFVLVALVAGGVRLLAGPPTATGPDYHDGTRRADPVATLIGQHDCWTSNGPAGVIPGHVVATLPSGRLVYGGQRLTARALDQLFANKPAGLTIHAFCR